MTSTITHRSGLYLLLVVALAWFGGHWLGPGWFDNNWSFTHWQVFPGWFGFLWLAVAVAGSVYALKYADQLGSLFSRKRNVIIGLTVLTILFVLFRFDSFLHGGGNYRVSQIAQAPAIIFRWFEFGATVLAAVLFKGLSLFPIRESTAGVLAWRTLSMVATGLSMIGAVKIVSKLTVDKVRRFFWFVIVVFGPQMLLYFGFVGFEPIVVALVIWFSYYAVRLEGRFSGKDIAVIWGIVLGGVLIHYTLAFMVPAALYLSLATGPRRDQRRYVALLVSLVGYIGLIYALYAHGESSLEFSGNLLFFNGKAPQADYGLFSPRRMGDIFQILFLVAPLALVVKWLAFSNRGWLKNRPASVAVWWLAFGGTSVVLTHDPVNSIVLDLPRLVAYLTPFSIMAVLILRQVADESRAFLRLQVVMAAASVALGLAYIPAYVDIHKAAAYSDIYFERQPSFYRTAGLSLRDSYFYAKDFDQANYWEGRIRIKSSDVLNLQGCRDLAAHGDVEEALTILKRIIIREPYWTEPRQLVAALQLERGRPHLAKPQIDTCLLLAPYDKSHLIIQYGFHRMMRNYPEAIRIIERALRFFPGDTDILTDKMLIANLVGDAALADALADQLLAQDPSLPHPYWVKGNRAEQDGDLRVAIEHYRQFLRLAPRDPDAGAVSMRLDSLNLRLRTQ